MQTPSQPSDQSLRVKPEMWALVLRSPCGWCLWSCFCCRPHSSSEATVREYSQRRVDRCRLLQAASQRHQSTVWPGLVWGTCSYLLPLPTSPLLSFWSWGDPAHLRRCENPVHIVWSLHFLFNMIHLFSNTCCGFSASSLMSRVVSVALWHMTWVLFWHEVSPFPGIWSVHFWNVMLFIFSDSVSGVSIFW